MNLKDVKLIIFKKYKEYTERIIEEVKELDNSSLLSGNDSGLENVWEEFAFQIQDEQSIFFTLYEDTIQQIIFNLVKSLPDSEIKLLWFRTDGYLDYVYDHDYDESEPLPFDDLIESVVYEIYSYVVDRAANENLDDEDLDDEDPDDDN